MKRDPLKASVLAAKIIPNASPEMLKDFDNIPENYKSLALITADSDDVTYTALDEATKKADVVVAYAKSFYGGAANANTKLAGEIIGILAGPNPAEVKSGLDAAIDMIENGAYFVSANDDDSICYYAHCISRTGSYLSEGAGIPEGEGFGLSDRTASRGHVWCRCSFESRRRQDVRIIRAAFRNKLWRRIINRHTVSL